MPGGVTPSSEITDKNIIRRIGIAITCATSNKSTARSVIIVASVLANEHIVVAIDISRARIGADKSVIISDCIGTSRIAANECVKCPVRVLLPGLMTDECATIRSYVL